MAQYDTMIPPDSVKKELRKSLEVLTSNL